VSFDISRNTFNPRKDYRGVVMQQGRVQLDADWNEWLAELSRRMQAGTLDILGRAVYPATTPYAFMITASSSGGTNTLTIGPGRMYVDGLLVENHGDPTAAVWDPVLGELSNTPQPPLAAESGAIDYTQQPYMPPGTPSPAGSGPFLAYLDVWVRPVDFLNDPDLIEKAVAVDSTGRLQTVWQVQLLDLSNSPGATCNSDISGWPPPASAGLLTTGTTPTPPSGPCCLTAGTAYTGMENQLYRVEIHQAGTPEGGAVPPTVLGPGIATFKWSRDNGSVVTGVTTINNVTNVLGNPASQLSVQSLGRDQVLGFAPGNWIEIVDDALEFGGRPGELHQIDTIDFSARTITLANKLSGFSTGDTDPTRHTRIRRWDMSGKVYEQDGTTVWWDIDAEGSADIPVPPSGTSLILENSIIVSFDLSVSGGSFLTRDFWNFAARTGDGSVEKLDKAPTRGLHHHYTRLSIVTFPSSATDCRTSWPLPPGTQEGDCGCCCTVTVGDGVESVGQYTSINAAINFLTNGGEVCILPGRYFENVFIQGKHDIVLRGCGWRTRIASASLRPETPPAVAAGGASAASSSSTVFAAVITVTGSQHVKLLSFAVEAAKDEVGILLDGTGKISATPPSNPTKLNVRAAAVDIDRRVIDVTIEDLIITASTRPGLLAASVALLQVDSNRIAMANVRSKWPAVWISGIEMRLVHNWVGVQSSVADREWLPVSVQTDLAADSKSTSATFTTAPGAVSLNPGGIQIAGPSSDVFVLENEIENSGRNAITLGSVLILDNQGNDTGLNGVTITIPGPCDTSVTIEIPGTPGGQGGGSVVAGGRLLNIQINRNRLRNSGLCGIGPVGFFNLVQAQEIITIENLTIAANTILRSLLLPLLPLEQGTSVIGYGAICLPDVQNAVIRDNSITDFGEQPGDDVCGIFILHGEMVEISRNHVLETRDWSEEKQQKDEAPTSATRGGIIVMMATPPTLASTNTFAADTAGIASAYLPPFYLPGLPALRVEHNVVRVPLGRALEAYGYGPFTIVNNQLACGGRLSAGGRPLGETVLILNLGTAIEAGASSGKFSNLNHDQSTFTTVNTGASVASPSNGVVLFTNNVCQLETRLNGRRCFASVVVASLDDVIFGQNQCWLDGQTGTAFLDAFLIAGSIQVTGNRFQEARNFPVLASGFTIGALNITSQNISTYCLFATGLLQPAIDNNNLSLISSDICDRTAQALKLNYTK
jgi:hypothetical protein